MGKKQPTEAGNSAKIPTSRFELEKFDNLDDYLDDDFNHAYYLRNRRIFNGMEEVSIIDRFTLMELRNLYSDIAFIKEHLDSPSRVENRLGLGPIDIVRKTIISEYAEYLNCPALSESRALKHIRNLISAADAETRATAERLLEIYASREARPNEQSDDSLGVSNEEDAERIKLLADICPSFARATPDTQQVAWRLLRQFTRKQWAYFADRANILTKLKKFERAKRIEAISNQTNLRTLFGTKKATAEGVKKVWPGITSEDIEKVNPVITLLNADSIKARTE